MRHLRYIAAIGETDAFGLKRSIQERAIGITGLEGAFTAPGVALFAQGGRRAPLAHDAGLVLGRIHRRAGAMPCVAAFSPDETDAVLATRGQSIIDMFWGDFLAFVVADGSVTVIRPPFSDLPCLHLERGGLHVLASDLALLKTCLQTRISPNWDAIALHLMTSGLRQERTCVEGVSELLGGSRLTLTNSAMSIEPCWSPWHAAGKRDRRSSEDLADMLWKVARTSVAAQIEDLDHVAVMLSGGLDSSFLAALVAATGTRMTCVNIGSNDPAGDERHFATAVATALAAPYKEVGRDLAEVDVTKSLAKGQPRPLARSFAQASRIARQSLAASLGAQAILDGGGGDNLFCAMQSVVPVADRLLMEGLGTGALRTAAEIAELTEASLFTVLGRAFRRAWFRPAGYRWPIETTFVTTQATERAGPPCHRWLKAPHGALPGSAGHIGFMIAVENLLESFDGDIAEWSPLIAMPIVECALAIPTWRWFERGNNRAIARRALARHVPEHVAWRRGKGSPDGFVAQVFETNRSVLRDLLLDGALAAEGILDKAAAERVLSGNGPVRSHEHGQLLKVADVEAWVRTL
ncbi:asparagine synthase-related protein [Novosphingobium sp. PS1R-30]|uniref:asparagine synthase (glutamine-hydrolyzing) n=1 Tax=Novosphingobium anseongense TaxID=3133436 RepID=A0ABU8RU37_9SPHN